MSIKTRFSHFFYIIFVYIIIFIVSFNINYYIVFDFNFSLILRLFSLLIFNFFSFMTLITHLKSMFTNPGFVPFNFTFNDFDISKENFSLLSQQYNLYCNKCKIFRPFRAHHCKICNRCVLKMDIIVFGFLIALVIIIKRIFISFFFMRLLVI